MQVSRLTAEYAYYVRIKLSGPFRPQSLVGANLFLNSEFFAPDASHNGRLRPALHLPLRGAKRMLTT